VSAVDYRLALTISYRWTRAALSCHVTGTGGGAYPGNTPETGEWPGSGTCLCYGGGLHAWSFRCARASMSVPMTDPCLPASRGVGRDCAAMEQRNVHHNPLHHHRLRLQTDCAIASIPSSKSSWLAPFPTVVHYLGPSHMPTALVRLPGLNQWCLGGSRKDRREAFHPGHASLYLQSRGYEGLHHTPIPLAQRGIAYEWSPLVFLVRRGLG
jgi:hypothetical protein